MGTHNGFPRIVYELVNIQHGISKTAVHHRFVVANDRSGCGDIYIEKENTGELRYMTNKDIFIQILLSVFILAFSCS